MFKIEYLKYVGILVASIYLTSNKTIEITNNP